MKRSPYSLSIKSRLRIAVKMEIYLEYRIAQNPDVSCFEVITKEYEKFDISQHVFLNRMLLGWEQYGDREKFERYFALVQAQEKIHVPWTDDDADVEKTIVKDFPLRFCLPVFCIPNFESNSATACEHIYHRDVSPNLEGLYDPDDYHPDDPSSWNPDDYMEWEIDRLLDKPD